MLLCYQHLFHVNVLDCEVLWELIRNIHATFGMNNSWLNFHNLKIMMLVLGAGHMKLHTLTHWYLGIACRWLSARLSCTKPSIWCHGTWLTLDHVWFVAGHCEVCTWSKIKFLSPGKFYYNPPSLGPLLLTWFNFSLWHVYVIMSLVWCGM